LSPFIELAIGIQCQRACGNHEAFVKLRWEAAIDRMFTVHPLILAIAHLEPGGFAMCLFTAHNPVSGTIF
jgi:hypothetical protein